MQQDTVVQPGLRARLATWWEERAKRRKKAADYRREMRQAALVSKQRRKLEAEIARNRRRRARSTNRSAAINRAVARKLPQGVQMAVVSIVSEEAAALLAPRSPGSISMNDAIYIVEKARRAKQKK
jgi:hypothetical protein